MTINSAIMMELARQRHLDIARDMSRSGAASARHRRHRRHHRQPGSARRARGPMAAVAAVVCGTLAWGVFVTGLAALAHQPARVVARTAVSVPAHGPATAAARPTQPDRTLQPVGGHRKPR